jgi:hypothetical protein
MNLSRINKRLDDLEESKKAKKKREPFSTLEKFKSGELTGEEAIELLGDGNEPFSQLQITIIQSALLSDEEKYEAIKSEYIGKED